MTRYLRRLAGRVAADRSAATVLACNIVAIVFAFFNPPVGVSVMFLYWAECAAVGVSNCAKLCYLAPPGYSEDALARMPAGQRVWVRIVAVGLFFVVPYSMFLFGLFGMLYALGEREMQGTGHDYDIVGHLAGFWVPVLLIGAGHAALFFRNFLAKREYAGRDFEEQAHRPVRRAFYMFLVMFGACAAIIVTGQPGVALLLFIPFIIIADLEAHFREGTA